jgi:hypothetical protein
MSARVLLFCVLSALLGALAALPGAAAADIIGAGTAPYAPQAYPLVLGHTVDGAFSGPDDSDYLSFVVARAGETLQFTVQNTTPVCQDPYDAGCPVYLTLMDQTGLSQVGGSNSGAGTIATFGDTESFGWTFAAPGTYYVLMESDGDLSAGSPTYSVLMSVPAMGTGGSGGGGSGSGKGGGSGLVLPLVRSLTVLPRQTGTSVAATVVLGQPAASLRMTLTRPSARSRTVATRVLHGLRVGKHRVTVRLPAALRRKLLRGVRLSLLVRITVTGTSGRRSTFTRRVTLRR